MESQLDVTLLDRNSRNVRLTEAGEALLREGRKTLSQAQHAIRTTRAAGAPELTVGFYGSAGNDLLADARRRLVDGSATGHPGPEARPDRTAVAREMHGCPRWAEG